MTYDQINTAFSSGSVLKESDDHLMSYLFVLCGTQIRNDENRLIANNRCVTINAVLMRRFFEKTNLNTTRLAWTAVLLAGLSLIAIIVEIVIAVS